MQGEWGDISPTYLWHLRVWVGHTNLERINKVAKDGPLNFLKLESFPTCESCLQGKMTKLSFTKKGTRCKDTLDLIHSDVCGPINHLENGSFIHLYPLLMTI